MAKPPSFKDNSTAPSTAPVAAPAKRQVPKLHDEAPAKAPTTTEPYPEHETSNALTPQDLPNAKGRAVVKDPSTGKMYPADSEEGKSLVENGWAKVEFIDETPAGAARQSLAPVKAMQQALVNFSRAVASHNIQNVADRQTSKGETLNGSNAFMNFLVTAYMNKAKTQGKQLVNTDEKQPVRMDTAKINDNFKGVLNTINRLGTPGSEQTPDGDWGPRTNNALKQVYALAYALNEVQKDIGINIGNYTDADLTEFYNNIPPEIKNVSVNEKIAKATVLAKSLNKLTNLYDNFRDKVLDNPTYAAHISQEKPLMVNKVDKKDGAGVLTLDEKQAYEENKSVEIDTTLNGHKVTVMPYNLYSMDTFKKFLNSKAPLVGFTKEQLDAIQNGDNVLLQHYLNEVANGIK